MPNRIHVEVRKKAIHATVARLQEMRPLTDKPVSTENSVSAIIGKP